jgi:hypothetical protein
MSFGDHAKMSQFSRRKLLSLLSYLAERLVPMMTNLEGLLSSNRIFLVSLAGLNYSTGDWRASTSC